MLDNAERPIFVVRVTSALGVPKILQWRRFTWWGAGPGREVWGREFPVGSRGKAPVWGLGDGPLEAKAKCEINVHFLTFTCRIFRI